MTQPAQPRRLSFHEKFGLPPEERFLVAPERLRFLAVERRLLCSDVLLLESLLFHWRAEAGNLVSVSLSSLAQTVPLPRPNLSRRLRELHDVGLIQVLPADRGKVPNIDLTPLLAAIQDPVKEPLRVLPRSNRSVAQEQQQVLPLGTQVLLPGNTGVAPGHSSVAPEQQATPGALGSNQMTQRAGARARVQASGEESGSQGGAGPGPGSGLPTGPRPGAVRALPPGIAVQGAYKPGQSTNPAAPAPAAKAREVLEQLNFTSPISQAITPAEFERRRLEAQKALEPVKAPTPRPRRAPAP